MDSLKLKTAKHNTVISSIWGDAIGDILFDSKSEQISALRKLIDASTTKEHGINLMNLLFEWSDFVNNGHQEGWSESWICSLSWMVDNEFWSMFFSTLILLKKSKSVDEQVVVF